MTTIKRDSRVYCNMHQVITRPRPESASAIPRPVSGTSRQASSTLVIPTDSEGTIALDPERLFSPQHLRRLSNIPLRSFDVNNGMPPTSYPAPKATLPRSDSSMPYNDRPQGDLSGVKEQLHIQSLSTRKVDVLKDHASRPQAFLPMPSVQMKTLLSEVRPQDRRTEIKPRTLMKPLQPTLPRSQTAGSLACFSGLQEVSPSRPIRRSNPRQVMLSRSGSKLDVMDALLESRMTNHEFKILDNVRYEMLANQKRLSATRPLTTSKIHEKSSTAYGNVVSGQTATLNLSVNDEANTRRLEEQQRRAPTKRPLFVNTSLANTVKTYEASPLSYSTPQSESTYFSISSSGTSPDPRNVYKAEKIGYWTGRFVAASDRLRKADCEFLLGSVSNQEKTAGINSTAFEDEFDKLEASRTTRVIHELKQYCKSEDAFQSLLQFECQLKRRLINPPPVIMRSYSEVFSRRDKNTPHNTRIHKEVTGIKQYSGNSTTSQISILNAQATIEKISGLVGRNRGFPKSRTTGNLILKSASERIPTPGLIRTHDNEPKSSTLLASPRLGKSSYVKSNSQAGAIYNLEPEGQNSGNTLEQPLESTNPSVTIDNGRRGRAEFLWPLRPLTRNFTTGDGMHCASVITTSTIARTDGKVKLPPLPKSVKDNLQNVREGGSIKETIIYQKRRGDRGGSGQSSGEFVKKVVGASLREVRKMSRRVSSMGFGSSSDDLTSSGSTRLK